MRLSIPGRDGLSVRPTTRRWHPKASILANMQRTFSPPEEHGSLLRLFPEKSILPENL
jgi:hypothetical protein